MFFCLSIPKLNTKCSFLWTSKMQSHPQRLAWSTSLTMFYSIDYIFNCLNKKRIMTASQLEFESQLRIDAVGRKLFLADSSSKLANVVWLKGYCPTFVLINSIAYSRGVEVPFVPICYLISKWWALCVCFLFWVCVLDWCAT